MDPTQSTTATNTIPNPEVQKVPEAVQQRFDELTGTIHEMRRQAEANNQLQQELIAQNAALNVRMLTAPQAQPAGPQIPEGMDPTAAQYMAKLVAETMAQNNQVLEQRISQLVGGIRQSQQQTEFQQATAGVDPAVAKEAAKFMQAWARAGNTGWTAQDAVIYAEGALARTNRVNQNRMRPNGESNDAVTQGGANTPNPVANRNLPPPKSDAELKVMSLSQQEAYWAGRAGDSELTY